MWPNMTYGDGGFAAMHGGGYWLGMGLHGLFWFLLVATIAVSAVWAMRAAGRTGLTAADAGPTAQEILDTRFARGEIERDGYLLRGRDLGRRTK